MVDKSNIVFTCKMAYIFQYIILSFNITGTKVIFPNDPKEIFACGRATSTH